MRLEEGEMKMSSATYLILTPLLVLLASCQWTPRTTSESGVVIFENDKATLADFKSKEVISWYAGDKLKDLNTTVATESVGIPVGIQERIEEDLKPIYVNRAFLRSVSKPR